MRVALFTDIDLDSHGGSTTALRALLVQPPPELQIRIYTFSALEVDEPNYRALRGNALTGIRPMRRELERDGAELVHMASSGQAGHAARRLARDLGLPLIGSLDTSALQLRSRLAHSYLRWMYARCARALVPSVPAAATLTAHGWAPERISVWRRGVDTQLFAPVRRSVHVREGWHVSSKRPAILVAGRLTSEKGVGLIEALGSLLHRQRIAHQMVILSTGPLLRALRARCPDAVFTAGIARADLPVVMASADVLLYPTVAGSGGSVLLEAQASGLPVVAANEGSARDNLIPGSTGYICRAHDVEEFAVRLGLLLVDPDRRRGLGRAARAYACERSWKASFEELVTAYREALTGGARASGYAPALSALPGTQTGGQR